MCGISVVRVAAEIEEHMTLWFSSLPVKLCSTETATCENADKNPGAVVEEREKMDDFSASLEEVSSMNEMA